MYTVAHELGEQINLDLKSECSLHSLIEVLENSLFVFFTCIEIPFLLTREDWSVLFALEGYRFVTQSLRYQRRTLEPKGNTLVHQSFIVFLITVHPHT